jgi:hypothetical protein
VSVSLAELEQAIRESWARHTSDDPDGWTAELPSWGHCAVTAHLLRDLLGGEILVAPVIGSDVNDHHLWNRLPSGLEIDFTFDQFTGGQTLGPPWVGEATPDTQPRIELFRRRVLARLGLAGAA